MNQYLILFNTQTGSSLDLLPVFKNSKKEAIEYLKVSGKEGWVYKVKAIAFSHKVEEVKVELVRKIKVEPLITLEPSVSNAQSSSINLETEFNSFLRCFFCGNKGTIIVDQKPLCKDCGGV